jgi:hypothetical protein
MFPRMIRLRIWVGHLVDPPFRFFSHIMFKLMGYSRLRLGTLTFWGPPKFIEAGTAAVQRLCELDSVLHDHLTTRQRLEFVYLPTRLEDMYAVRIFSVDDSYMAWKLDGIIARLVYSAQFITLYPRRVDSEAKSRALHSQIRATTKSWLEAHHFPQPLIDCFQEKAAPPNTALEPTASPTPL